MNQTKQKEKKKKKWNKSGNPDNLTAPTKTLQSMQHINLIRKYCQLFLGKPLALSLWD